jgi:hypothetical protein
MPPGVLGLRPGNPARCEDAPEADLATPYTSAVAFPVQSKAGRSSLTSIELRLMYTSQSTHIYSRVMVSAIGPEAPRIKYPNRLVDWERAVTSRAHDRCDPVAPSRGLAARAKNARPRLVFNSRVLSLVTRLTRGYSPGHPTNSRVLSLVTRLRHIGTRGYPSGSTRLYQVSVSTVV